MAAAFGDSDYGCRNTTALQQPLFHDREAVLADAAKRAGPVVGNGLKGGAGGDAAIGVAFFWVVDVTADVANVLFHFCVIFLLVKGLVLLIKLNFVAKVRLIFGMSNEIGNFVEIITIKAEIPYFCSRYVLEPQEMGR